MNIYFFIINRFITNKINILRSIMQSDFDVSKLLVITSIASFSSSRFTRSDNFQV